MAYRFVANQSVAQNIRRIAREQIDEAVTMLTDTNVDREEAVHQVRTQCKRLRALIRLARAELDFVYKRENRCFRDAARQLSTVRDADVMIKTFDWLRKQHATHLNQPAYRPVRRELMRRRNELAENEEGLSGSIEKAVNELRQARQRVRKWPFLYDGFCSLAPGLKLIYRQGRATMRRARNRPGGENYHEWRKNVKYLMYHVQLLGDIWPTTMKTLRGELRELATCLGRDHDLVVLRDLLLLEPDAFGAAERARVIVELIDESLAELRPASHKLGERVYAEKPAAFLQRVEAYWDVWQSDFAGDVTPMPQTADKPLAAVKSA